MLCRSFSISYGSVLVRPKDWRGVDVHGRRDSKPENYAVIERSQQMQTKRERAQTEEETSKEEQNKNIKRRF
jgi:hypothetical protein